MPLAIKDERGVELLSDGKLLINITRQLPFDGASKKFRSEFLYVVKAYLDHLAQSIFLVKSIQ